MRLLTIPFACAKHPTAMHKTSLSIFAATAMLSLAACGGSNEPEVIDTRAPDPLASQIANAPAVELPPAIAARTTLRCGDNSLIYVDFFQGDELVNFRAEEGDTPTQLRAEAAGQPYTNGEITVEGNAQQVSVTRGGSTLNCKA